MPECYVCRRISPNYLTHSRCKSCFSLDSVCVLWEYNSLSSTILKRYKYALAYDIGSSINKLVIEALSKIKLPLNDRSVILPVPVATNRLKERGFNQVEDITRSIANYLGCKYRSDILYRFDDGSIHQSMLDREERLLHKGNFSVPDPSMLDDYSNVIIVDDVITTGSTLEQISKVIKECNTNISVSAICLFRGRPYYK